MMWKSTSVWRWSTMFTMLRTGPPARKNGLYQSMRTRTRGLVMGSGGGDERQCPFRPRLGGPTAPHFGAAQAHDAQFIIAPSNDGAKGVVQSAPVAGSEPETVEPLGKEA